MKVYLCGSIKGKNFAEANAWREEATKALDLRGHETINPLRGRVWNSAEEQKRFTMREIVDRDLRDIDLADCLLVEYTEPKKYGYVGTITEMTRARMADKPIVVFTGGEVDTFGWLSGYLATKICISLEDALIYIVDIIN